MKSIRFNMLIRIGFITASLMGDTKELCENCHAMYSLFKVANKYDVYNERKAIQEHKRKMQRFMKEKISEINREIDLYNENMVKINPDLTLTQIEYSNIDKELSHFYKTTEEETNSQTKERLLPYLINSLDLWVFNKVKQLPDRLSYVKDIMDLNVESFGLDEIKSKYHEHLYEIIDLHLMGYRATSLLVLGRVFEEIITNYLLILSKYNKIDLIENTILNMRFENKLGFLKSNGFVSEKDWLIISKLRFDRNIGGHFVDGELKQQAEKESESTIKLAFTLINKFDKKLETVN
ncbi:MAG: hypothetical protein HY530_04195 [Chloroflexi bacterium]|nr:hypothetical protein [Chloroflexota bacterium]